MIHFHIHTIALNSNALRAYVHQLIRSDFQFSMSFIDKIIGLHPELPNKEVSLWDLNTLNDEDLESLFSDIDQIPDHFFYFNTTEELSDDSQQHNTLIHEESDYRNYPELFTNIHQVSFDLGGLIGMQLFNQQIYNLYNPVGEELISHCHDLHLGAGGLVLFRSSKKDSGIWELLSYNGIELHWESAKLFGPFDSPPDFPDLEDRDKIPLMLRRTEKLPYMPLENETIERDRLLNLLQQNNQNYRYLSSCYSDDYELAEKAISINKLAFTLLSVQLQYNHNFINRLLSNPAIDKHLFNYLPAEFKQKEEYILQCLEVNPRIIKILEPVHSKKLLLKAIELNLWSALQYASEELQSDLDCIKMAMRKEWKAIRYVPEELISNHEFFTSLLDWYNEDIQTNRTYSDKKNSLSKLQVIEYLSPFKPIVMQHLAPLNDLDQVVYSARNLPTTDIPKFLDNCSNSLKGGAVFWLTLLKANSNSMHFIPTPFLQNYKFLLEAGRIHGEILTLVSENHANEEELAYQGIHQIVHRRGFCSPENIIPHIGEELMNDVDFIKRVILIWPSIVNYLCDSLKNNEELFLYAIQYSHPWVISRVSNELQHKLDFVLKALQINENVFHHLSPNMKSNKTVQENINEVTLQNYLNSLNSPNRSDSSEEEDDDLPF